MDTHRWRLCPFRICQSMVLPKLKRFCKEKEIKLPTRSIDSEITQEMPAQNRINEIK